MHLFELPVFNDVRPDESAPILTVVQRTQRFRNNLWLLQLVRTVAAEGSGL